MKRKLIVFFAMLLALAFTVGSLYAAERKTRDLVFEDEEAPAAAAAAEEAGMEDATVISIRTTIELTREGVTTYVLPTHEFQSGDKVRFIYTANMDGYIYWLAEGTTGSYQMLFPNEKAGMDNQIKKNEEYSIPVKGNWAFDENPGTENLLVILSPERIPELDEAAGIDAGVAQVTEDNTSKRQTRDLVFEDEEDTDSGVSTKSQASANPAEPFVAYYELMHK